MTENWIIDLLLLASSSYFIALAAPGPGSKLTTDSPPLQSFAHIVTTNRLGGFSGALAWWLIVCYFISKALDSDSPLTSLLQVTVGLYSLWIVAKAIHNAITDPDSVATNNAPNQKGIRKVCHALLKHPSHPYSITLWLATIAIATLHSTIPNSVFIQILVCWILGVLLYSGHAILIKRSCRSDFYDTCCRRLDVLITMLFGVTSLVLLNANLQLNVPTF